MEDECEFLLSRIRFLGLWVNVVEGRSLRKRMQETAEMLLVRYAQDEV